MSIFGLLTVKALYFPFALIFLDLIQAGPQAAIVSLTGVMAGHIWYMLEWQRGGGGGRGVTVGKAPGWLSRLVDEDAAPGTSTQDRRPYGTAHAPRDRDAPAATTRHPWGRGNVLGSE